MSGPLPPKGADLQSAAFADSLPAHIWCLRQGSNLLTRGFNPLLYQLSYRGMLLLCVFGYRYINRANMMLVSFSFFMAARVGLEPTTLRLTAGCSTIELTSRLLENTQQRPDACSPAPLSGRACDFHRNPTSQMCLFVDFLTRKIPADGDDGGA